MYNTKEEIVNWLNEMDIKKYVINEDLTVDVNTNVYIKQKFKMFNLPIQFNTIKGSFVVRRNTLTTLKGFPYKVFGNFSCEANNLTNLEYAPYSVDGNFLCMSNKLTSLKNCPKEIGDTFDCSYNLLTDLLNGPEVVKNNYICHNNRLMTFNGISREFVNLNCMNNHLNNFMFLPNNIKTLFMTGNNFDEKSLLNFNIDLNKLKMITSDFHSGNNVNDFICFLNSVKEKYDLLSLINKKNVSIIRKL